MLLVVEEPGSDIATVLWDGCADAVHLASALEIDASHLVVAVWDRRLHAGAAAEGLIVAPRNLQA